jgi:starch synthase
MNVCLITLSNKGMIHYSSQLVNALRKINRETYLITAETVDLSLFSERTKIYCVPYPDRLLSSKSFRFDALMKYIRHIKPEIIHISVEHPWIIPSIFFLKLKKIPIVGTLHDVKAHHGDWSSFLRVLSLEFLKRFSDILIVHGNNMKEDLINSGVSENKIKVIPHGDYEFFTKLKKANIDERNSVLFFGRIMKYKGLICLLKSIPLIVRECPDVKITIAGEGDLSDYIEFLEQNQHHLEIYNSFIADQNIAELFQKAKLIVLPYTEASQSGIVHIAYAFRKPVVATNVGALPEVVEHGRTGLLIPVKDVNALAKAVIKLLKDDMLRKEMGENAYTKMKEEMSWDKIAEKTIEVYKEAIELNKKDEYKIYRISNL